MTRKEEIEQAAEEYYNKVKYLSDLSAFPIAAFKAGAEWADKTMIDVGENIRAKQCEIILHELRESEDERIRKALIKAVTSIKKGESPWFVSDKETCNKVIAWLENVKTPFINNTDNSFICDIKNIIDEAPGVLQADKNRLIAWLEMQGTKISVYKDTLFKIATILSQYEDKEESPLEKIRSIMIYGTICSMDLESKKQGESKFEQCIQEGDKIVTNEDGTHFNVSQLERVAKKVTDTKETATEFLKSAKIMDGNDELADEYRLENQGEKNPYSGVSFKYNGHTWGMCARDNGVEILFDGELKAFVSSEKSFVFPIHPQPDLAPKNAMEAIKEEKVNNANKVEPKFKVGNWVVREYEYTKDIITINQVVDVKRIDDEHFGYTLDDGTYFSGSWENSYHLWTIQDAKDGDVLVGSEVILMFRGIGNTEWDDVIDYHCYYNCYRKCFFVQEHVEHWGNAENNQLKPATKEQRDFLFQKMHEAGYEWDAEKKELKKIHIIDEGKAEMDYCFTKMMNGEKVSSAWSEEDTFKVQRICKYLDEAKKYYADITEVRECMDWLKSLKDRMKGGQL